MKKAVGSVSITLNRCGKFLLSGLRQLQNVLEEASVVVWKKSTSDGARLASVAIIWLCVVMLMASLLVPPSILPDIRPLMWYIGAWIIMLNVLLLIMAGIWNLWLARFCARMKVLGIPCFFLAMYLAFFITNIWVVALKLKNGCMADQVNLLAHATRPIEFFNILRDVDVETWVG